MNETLAATCPTCGALVNRLHAAAIESGSLDAAWPEVEAALPLHALVGWPSDDGRWVIPNGWSIMVDHIDAGDGYFEPHEEAYRAKALIHASGVPSNVIYGPHEPTPAAALRALAVKLRERTG